MTAKIGNFRIAESRLFADKRAISKDLVLTLGFIILTVMVLAIGINLITPLVKTTPKYIVLDAAKAVDSAVASPENVVVTFRFAETLKEKGPLGIITWSKKLSIKVDGNKICIYKREYEGGPTKSLACERFTKDAALSYKVRGEFFGKMIIEKEGDSLTFT